MRPIHMLFLVAFLFLPVLIFGQNAFPQVAVEDLNGQKIDLPVYFQDGNPKIVSLWATWCGPCRMELNALKKVYPKWKKNYNVEIVAITVDFPSMLNRAKDMFEKNEWDYTFLYDKDQELLKELGIRAIPYSMLIDGQGNIQSVQTGYFPGYEKELEMKIKAL